MAILYDAYVLQVSQLAVTLAPHQQECIMCSPKMLS